MIESKEQLLGNFRSKAEAFMAAPGPVTGIDLDDAAVTLKRYVLTELRDQTLASKLGALPKLIRRLDVASIGELLTEIGTAIDTR
jgi:hypothetical protein